MTYTVLPTPLSAREQVVATDDPAAIQLLRSMRARHAARHGWFLRPSRVRIFEALMEVGAVWAGGRRYRFPDGCVCDIYDATRYIRRQMNRRVIA